MKARLRILFSFIGIIAALRAFPAQPSGMVVGWGNINFEEYGILSGFQTNGVVMISNHILTNAVAVSPGSMSSLAVLENGDVVGWGRNGWGQANNLPSKEIMGTNGPVVFNGLPLTDVIAVAAGNTYCLALRKDGTVLTWGGSPDVKGNIGAEVLGPKGMRNIKAIAAGDERSLILKEDGTVAVFGDGNSAPKGLTNIISIAAGVGGWGREDAALKRDGTVVTWNVRGIPGQQARQPEGMSNIVAISAGGAHILALQDNGTVWGWGYNRNGEATGEPTELNRSAARIINSGKVLDNKSAIAAGKNQLAAGVVRINGKVLDDVSAIAAGYRCSLALKKDGTLVFWGDDDEGRMRPPADLSGVVAIALSDSQGLAITTNKAVLSR